jgi:hypothetical protein
MFLPMMQFRLPRDDIRLKATFILEILLFCLLCAIAILEWLSHLLFTPDSATYITAANNLLRTAHFTFFVNYTNWVNAPALVPYMEQPPGFPLLLVPFLVIIRDPIISATVAQSCYIAILFMAVYLITIRLRFSPLLRMVTLVLFSFIVPLRLIRNRFWSETLFIGLSLAAAYCAIGILTGSERKRDWKLYLAFLALSVMVRYEGVANLALIALLLLKWNTVSAIWHFLTHKYVLRGILVLGVLVIASSLLGDLLPVAKPGIGPLQWYGIILGTAGLMIGAGGLLLIQRQSARRLDTGYAPTVPDSREMRGASLAAISIFVATAPLLAWFARNNLVSGSISRANKLFQAFHEERVFVPFEYVWNELLNIHLVPRPLQATLILVLLLLPLLLITALQTSRFRRTSHIVLLGAALTHFAFVWFLSLVSNVEPIRYRYISPALAFILLALCNGLQNIIDALRPRLWRHVVAVAPVIFLIFSEAYSLPDLSFLTEGIAYPPEEQLWQEIDQIEWTHNSSFFYSDTASTARGYIHQIFSGKPQGIIWDRGVLHDPERLRSILSIGINPFILVKENSDEDNILGDLIAKGVMNLKRIRFPKSGYSLYYLND